jgi:hypothetical protein
MIYLLWGFQIIIVLVVILALPENLEKDNAKLIAKGKPPLTAEEHRRVYKKARIIACIIAGASTMVITVIPIIFF